MTELLGDRVIDARLTATPAQFNCNSIRIVRRHINAPSVCVHPPRSMLSACHCFLLSARDEIYSESQSGFLDRALLLHPEHPEQEERSPRISHRIPGVAGPPRGRVVHAGLHVSEPPQATIRTEGRRSSSGIQPISPLRYHETKVLAVSLCCAFTLDNLRWLCRSCQRRNTRQDKLRAKF